MEKEMEIVENQNVKKEIFWHDTRQKPTQLSDIDLVKSEVSLESDIPNSEVIFKSFRRKNKERRLLPDLITNTSNYFKLKKN